MVTSRAESVRRAGLALIAGALITAVGGAASQIVQASTSVSDDLWRYPWSSDLFVPISVLWAFAHVLVIVGLLGLRRSGVAGPTRSAAVGLALAIAGTGVLLVAEFASLPFAGDRVADTGPARVGATFGLGTALSAVGLLLTGRATLQARRWDGWPRFTPLVAGGWTLILLGVAATKALPTGVAIYGLCLLAIGIAMYTRPSAATAVGAPHAQPT
ncbi:MAG: hypothetical protein H0V05_14035 [Euzebyaceae bacterium]|nr:hypothetical protein [Euzebyaceae bacterium]